MFTESRLQATKVSHEYTKQLLDECKNHIDTLYDMLEVLSDIVANKNPGSQDAAALGKLLDPVIRDAHRAVRLDMSVFCLFTCHLVLPFHPLLGYRSSTN